MLEATIKALKDVHDELVPDYRTRLDQAHATLTKAIVDSGGKEIILNFADTLVLIELTRDMKSAVYMLEQHLKASIHTLEIAEIMNTPAKRGRPKKGDEG